MTKPSCGLQAHARLLARDTVTRQDAVVAIYIVEASVMDSFALLGSQDARQAAYPSDPDAEYQHMESHVLDIMALHQAGQDGLDSFSLEHGDDCE